MEIFAGGSASRPIPSASLPESGRLAELLQRRVRAPGVLTEDAATRI